MFHSAWEPFWGLQIADFKLQIGKVGSVPAWPPIGNFQSKIRNPKSGVLASKP
jgi:hypothetical protein